MPRRSASGSSSATRSSTSRSARARSRISATGSPPEGMPSPRGRFGTHGTFAGPSRCTANARSQAWVQVSMGCNSACSYRIVPAVRGREQSRRPGDIVAEVERLAAEGVSEITLLGQNVNSWGRDLAPGVRTEFGELLRACDASRASSGSASRARIRRTSARRHRRDGRVRRCVRARPPAAPVRLFRILKSMRRTYTRERYLRLVDGLRYAIPDLALGTDIIVGFPGETEGLRARRSRSSRRSDTTARSRSSSRRGRYRGGSACPIRFRTTSKRERMEAWSPWRSASPPSATPLVSAASTRSSSKAEPNGYGAAPGPDPSEHDGDLRGRRASAELVDVLSRARRRRRFADAHSHWSQPDVRRNGRLFARSGTNPDTRVRRSD